MTTTAFAVSTSHSGAFTSTCAPSSTRHATSCASVKPSPRSGSRKVCSAIGERHVRCLEDSIDVREVQLLEAGGRIGRVHGPDPGDRRLEQVEAVVGDARGNLATEAAKDGGLVDDDRPMCLAQRVNDGCHIEWRQGAKVDDLER